MQIEAQKSSPKFPPGSPPIPRLGINTESAHKAGQHKNVDRPVDSPSFLENPLISMVSGDSRKKSVIDQLIAFGGELGEKLSAKKKKLARKGVRFRHFMAMRQRQAIYEAGLASEFKSLCSCGAFPIPAEGWSSTKGRYLTGAPGEVQLSWRGKVDDGAPLVHCWVKRCANPLLCWVDAPKIRWFRSKEMQQITRQLYREGYKWLFFTFTAPHDVTTDPGFQVSRFQEAKRLFKKNWRRDFAEKWGHKFYIRSVEMTDDAPWSEHKSGCHFHHHEINFFERDEGFSYDEIAEMEDFLSRRWVDALMAVGICPPEKREAALAWAFRLDCPRRPKKKKQDKPKNQADSSKKENKDKDKKEEEPELSDEDLDEVTEYITKGAAIEITPGISAKCGHGKDRITHWDLMKQAFTLYPEAKPRALAVMLALKGRAWLYFSPGLREHCGLLSVKDEEILQEKNGCLVYSYSDSDWYDIDRLKAQDVLQNAILDGCESRGIDLSNLPRDSEKKGRLDMESPKVRKICDIADLNADFIIQTGCDPLTGESLETCSGVNLKIKGDP